MPDLRELSLTTLINYRILLTTTTGAMSSFLVLMLFASSWLPGEKSGPVPIDLQLVGIMFCHQTGGPITGWAYNRDFTVISPNNLFCPQTVYFLKRSSSARTANARGWEVGKRSRARIKTRRKNKTSVDKLPIILHIQSSLILHWF